VFKTILENKEEEKRFVKHQPKRDGGGKGRRVKDCKERGGNCKSKEKQDRKKKNLRGYCENRCVGPAVVREPAERDLNLEGGSRGYPFLEYGT